MMTAGVGELVAAALVLPLALLLDLVASEPPERVHPVCAMGALACGAERKTRRWLRCPARGLDEQPARVPRAMAVREFLAGLAAGLMVLVTFTAIPAAVTAAATKLCPIAGGLFAAAAVWLCMAPTSLDAHARRVARPLRDHDLAGARAAVSMIVGRETGGLDEHGVARACVESVAENFTDGVLASLLWALLGFLVFGFAGAAALPFLQRAANTLDAMWGKRNARYQHFGTFAARLDDLLVLPAARLALPLTAAAALFARGCDARAALAIGWRYRHAHESPNSAWSEAAFAGALGLTLGGPATYAGMRVDHPALGEGSPNADARHISGALALMWTATWLATGTGTILLVLLAWP